MKKSSKIYIAGHTGLVGSAIHRQLIAAGYTNIIARDLEELDLTSQAAPEQFFAKEKPEYVIDAAAKVGGIMANNTYRAQFIYENLMIQNNIIHCAYRHGIKKLLFLGSSCIYPKDAPQPLKEEYLLTGLLELTNEPYAIAKIAGIKMCESYYRQYNCNFISVMPTNLYGPNDNYNLETSHVLPAIIRKMHLAHCLETDNWEGIRKDLDKRPVEGLTGSNSEQEISKILSKFGINSNSSARQLISSSAHQLVSSSARQLTSSPVTIALWGTGKIFREFLHVDDMAQACIYVMNNVDAKKLYDDMKVSQINIGTGSDITIYAVALLVKEIVGYKGEITWDSTKPDGTYKKQLDVYRLNSLGWKESIPLRSGIKQVY
ncbi:MAG: GDP-L-fucose synthase, partial [Bacteroidales bacterium]